MTTNTIAAVIPVYNKELYVARAIESVLAQTRPVDEIIIVDDASTDGSLDQIQVFRDSRIRLLRRTTAATGPSRARNLAIGSATSRWIAFLDADDQWHVEFIEELQKLMGRASETVGCLFTGWQDVWPDGAVTQDAYSAKFRAETFSWLDMETFLSIWLELHSCPMCASAIAVRRDILLKAGLFPERCRRGEDKDTWLRVMTLTEAISSPRVCSTYYRGMAGQLNDAFSTNMRHCLCITLQGLIARTSGTRRRLLMRLFNHQVFEYARWIIGQGERVLPEVYRGFYVSVDPNRYLVLLASSYLPVPMQHLVREGIVWTRRAIGRPRSRAL
jgi:glycosyltransferase involved in cell wall biosynthesis